MEDVNDFILSGNFKEGMASKHAELRTELDRITRELVMDGYHDGWTLEGLKQKRLDIISKMNNCIDFSDRT
tara:strand:+ start:2627 stop:2839 length:213 start_codon:yes stop_codon:yes gene_type:complete